MPPVVTTPRPNDGPSSDESSLLLPKGAYWKMALFDGLLVLDLVASVLLLTPFVPWMTKITRDPGHHQHDQDHHHFDFYASLQDLGVLAAVRLTCAALGQLVAYGRALVTPEYYPLSLYHPNGEKKTRDELEEEALDELFSAAWFRRFVSRPSFSGELVALLTQLVCMVKCLWRMNVEIGTLQDNEPYHPVFWLAILWTAVVAAVEACYLESACQLAGQCGKSRRVVNRGGSSNRRRRRFFFFRTVSSTLATPLLAANGDAEAPTEQPPPDSSSTTQQPNGTAAAEEDEREISDISADTNYKAGWTDLLRMMLPDLHLLCFAFTFLLLAAISQTLIPLYLGHILDALSTSFVDHDDDAASHESMFQVPGFITNMKFLVLVSFSAGIFSGLRGSIFTVLGGRVNVRLRVQLMDSLLAQDIGFFDITKTGDITSRLSSDTTLVGDQVCLNVNVFLRSLVQALGVLGFMFVVSWQLSILAFISVPVITILSKWYGNYVRGLTKLMQKKLADGNSVSEAVLSAMPTVRAFDAAEIELQKFEERMKEYLNLTTRSAVAYCGYAALTTTLPELVFAVVVFYGGLLVRNGDLTSGQLVSFLLYLSSLSDAFANIGWVFSSITQAVGAADKVFELLHRQPRITPPSRTDDVIPARTGILGIPATRTRQQRLQGLKPATCRGEIEFKDVTLYYPARPRRRVLNGLSLKIEPGSIVALVGQSGGGKSSVMSLIQHLYEHSAGHVLIDGIDVHELSPSWLCRHVSVVSQEPTLFGRSIKSNIMYGLEGTDDEPSQQEIEEAAHLANADSFIQTMPQKYDTEVGERGVQLSGGQKQRIAIARALVRRPRVLLLDEATSALDAESEHLVQKAIDDMLARGTNEAGNSSMTVIIVAHRLSTVRSADRIFVVKEGCVVEQGSHDELVQDPEGAYSLLISRQMKAQQKLENGSDSLPQET